MCIEVCVERTHTVVCGVPISVHKCIAGLSLCEQGTGVGAANLLSALATYLLVWLFMYPSRTNAALVLAPLSSHDKTTGVSRLPDLLALEEMLGPEQCSICTSQ